MNKLVTKCGGWCIAIFCSVFLFACSVPSQKDMLHSLEKNEQSMNILVQAFRQNGALSTLWLDDVAPRSVNVSPENIKVYRDAMRDIGAFRVGGSQNELYIFTRSSGNPDSSGGLEGYLYMNTPTYIDSSLLVNTLDQARARDRKMSLVRLKDNWYIFVQYEK